MPRSAERLGRTPQVVRRVTAPAGVLPVLGAGSGAASRGLPLAFLRLNLSPPARHPHSLGRADLGRAVSSGRPMNMYMISAQA